MVAVTYYVIDTGFVIEVLDRLPDDQFGFSHLIDDHRTHVVGIKLSVLHEMARYEAAELAVKHGLAPTNIEYDHQGEQDERSLFSATKTRQ